MKILNIAYKFRIIDRKYFNVQFYKFRNMMDQKHEEPKFYFILNYGDRGSRTCLTVAVRSLPSAENLFVVNKVRFDVRFWLPCGSSKDGSGRWGRHCWRCFLR